MRRKLLSYDRMMLKYGKILARKKITELSTQKELTELNRKEIILATSFIEWATKKGAK